MRAHTVSQSSGAAALVPATQAPIAASLYTDDAGDVWRILRANGVSEHTTGAFPNSGNPHSVQEQSYSFRVPAAPQLTGEILSAMGQPFGIAVNGVVFDPGANEFYKGNRNAGWQYEPLRSALNMGLDAHHAHVQPGGAYHYHGLPTGLLEKLELKAGTHSPLVGWAADGFPIYALYGSIADDGAVVEMTSSYRVREGQRPSGNGNPGGTYDGTFIRDYEYIAGRGALDECNGREVITPDFPQGTYAYFLTQDWPVIPRCYKGTPASDFRRRRR
ncbi:MAG: YHYH protein [Pseudomonadota bacterium]